MTERIYNLTDEELYSGDYTRHMSMGDDATARIWWSKKYTNRYGVRGAGQGDPYADSYSDGYDRRMLTVDTIARLRGFKRPAETWSDLSEDLQEWILSNEEDAIEAEEEHYEIPAEDYADYEIEVDCNE
jgi:hypothetical protein